MRGLVASALLVGMLAGCAGSVGAGSGGETDTTVAVSETVEGVEYYYACGNEVLELPDGRRFYPFVDQDSVDEARYLGEAGVQEDAAGGEMRLARVVLAVVEAGPGDDTGTLTIHEDGIARWRSDSGIEAWLTDEEQTYEFDC